MSDTSHVDMNLSKSAAQGRGKKATTYKAVNENCGYGDLNAKNLSKTI